ncbi:hypothetical protein TWF696_002786 [Orbilia brochopaga]|uniref:DNA mismatch repair protein S5 domain-containing protein n=1 Tax=Orbilia brochopaga TaxID=3140254 RepID=A0AAV9TZW4_9PEZI
MTIHEIPQESVRRLGSTQVITDPITVIKELVENALDAKATSVIVEASADLLSHIQVKDNGGGIDPADRPLMAKPHCTSKISTFDDLLDVATLGFRGEALASLATVSGGLTITTRVKNESIAVACEIARDGSLKTISPVSAPIGCAVKVTNLFANFPVRKAALEKSSAKHLAQIRPLLLSYYLTHPQTRFQFKCVAGSQANQGKKKIDAKYDVIFAASSSKEQAVLKAFGAEPSRHGQWVNHGAKGDIQVEAFVVKPNADTAPASKKGVCIAYKNRPLSITRAQGLAHSIYSAYRKQIKAVFSARSVDTPTEPFLFLNILSGVGKADVNIEPAKDDVLFESNEQVMACIEECFESIYGNAKRADDGVGQAGAHGDAVSEAGRHFSSEVTEDSAVPSEVAPRGIPIRTHASATIPTSTSKNNRLSSSPPIKISSSAALAASHLVSQQPAVNDDSDNEDDDVDASCRQLQRENDTQEPEQGDEEAASPRPSPPPPPRGEQQYEQRLDSDWSFSMYGSGIDVDEDDFVDIEESLRESRKEAAREECIQQDVSIANPWTMSKMNARVSRSQTQSSNPTTMVPLLAASGSESRHPQQNTEAQSPRAGPPSVAPIINTPTPGAPVARMLASSSPLYPKPVRDSNRAPPNTRPQDQRRLSAEVLPPPARSERPRNSTRKSTGPMDSWVSSGQNRDRETESAEESEDAASPPKILFGKPDLRMSNTSGDGGRGIFPSASSRMRDQQNRSILSTDDPEDDEISFSEDEEPIPNRRNRPQKAAHTRPLNHHGRPEPIRLSLDQNFFNKPSREPTKSMTPARPDKSEAHTVVHKSKFLVTKLPAIDLRRLRFRSRLVQDDLYDDDYDSRKADITEAEMRKVFFAFLKQRIANIDHDDPDLQRLQQGIVDEKSFNVKFRNLADS